MGNEIFKPDSNFKAGGVVGGYSSADAAEATNPTKLVFRVNPTTMRLLVDVNGATTVIDGEAVNAADTGTLVLGTDGSNYQIIKTDSDGNLQVDVVSGAGGTQYTEGDTDSSITGTAMLMEGAGNVLVVAQGTATDGLLVNLGSNNDVVVSATNLDIRDLSSSSDSVAAVQSGSWSVTANAGTNLNTSLLALESGGNLATAVTHLATIAGDTTDIETAIELIDDTIFTAGTDTYTEATSKGQLLLAVRRDADTTLANTTNEFTPLQVDANGYLKVEVFSGATLPVSLTSTTITGTVAVTQSGTWDEVGINDSGNSITVDYATTGSGTATGALRVELPTNGTGTIATVGAVTAITNALPAGTNAIGKLAANSGVDIGDVDVTSISAGTNLIGDVGIQPRTTNGLDTFMASGSDGSSILVATAQAVKASAGKVYGYYLYNPEAAVTFVHFYNAGTGSVTVGTTNPLLTLAIPAGSAANLMSEIGITFGTAITIAATTTAGGNTAPSTGVSAVIWYK